MINKSPRMNLLVGLSAALLSSPALAAVAPASVAPGDAGVALSIIPRGPAPQVETLRQAGLAGRRFEADDGVRELLLIDGTSLALAPGGALTVERYAFDESAGTGELRVRLERGTLRVSGGRLNTVEPIVIETPAGIAELDDGGGTVEVDAEGRTYASLLYGEGLRLTADGETVELYRPGFGTEAAPGEAPSSPRRRPLSRTESVALALNPGLALGEEPAAGPETIAPSAEPELAGDVPTDAELLTVALDVEETEAEATSEERRADAAANRGDLQRDLSTTGSPDSGAPGAGGPNTGGIDSPTLGGNAGFGARPIAQRQTNNPLPSGRRGFTLFLSQNKEADTGEPRDLPPTANRLFQSGEPLTQVVLGEVAPAQLRDHLPVYNGNPSRPVARDGQDPVVASATPPLVQYEFLTEGGGGAAKWLLLDGVGDDALIPQRRFARAPECGNTQVGCSALINAPVRIELPNAGIGKSGAIQFFEQTQRSPSNDPFSLAFGGTSSVFEDFAGTDAFPTYKALWAGFRTNPFAPFTRPDEDNFLLLEIDAAVQGSAGPEHRTLVFATGEIGRFPDQTVSVDRFFVSPGLRDFDKKDELLSSPSVRSFGRKDTAAGLELVDTGLLVMRTSHFSNPFMQADFGFAGLGAEQKSTLSVTLGEAPLVFFERDPVDPFEGETVVQSGRGTIRTIGSTRNDAEQASVHFSGPLFVTAFGGGNPAFVDPDSSVGRPSGGRVGYLVLESDKGAQEAVNGNPSEPLSLHTEDPVGGRGEVDYALLRLATGVEETTEADLGSRNRTSFSGWIGGLAELETEGGVESHEIDSGNNLSDFAIETSPLFGQVEVTGTLVLRRESEADEKRNLWLGGLAVVGRPNPMGNTFLDGASIFINDDIFAARSDPRAKEELVLLTAKNLEVDFKDRLPKLPELPADPERDLPGTAAGSNIPEYTDLKWGFFFGDFDDAAGARNHIHLASWTAGRGVDPSRLPARGTATYTGHSFGNVFNDGALYSAVGSYQNTWDFGTRKGTVHMGFDGAVYKGNTRLRDGTAEFDGSLRAAGRAGDLRGAFFDRREALNGDFPKAVAGRFSIRESEGKTYRASGTFAAER